MTGMTEIWRKWRPIAVVIVVYAINMYAGVQEFPLNPVKGAAIGATGVTLFVVVPAIGLAVAYRWWQHNKRTR